MEVRSEGAAGNGLAIGIAAAATGVGAIIGVAQVQAAAGGEGVYGVLMMAWRLVTQQGVG